MNIVQVANRILDTINVILEYLMGGLMLVLVGVTFVEVVRRYAFNDPTAWASELCRFLLIWMTFTGASIVTRLVTHLAMGFTIHRFASKGVSRAIKVFTSGCVVFVMMVLTYYSAKVTLLAGYRSAPMTGMPMYVPWSALPINAAIMTIYMMAEMLINMFGKDEEVAP
jgi:TRAP-type C4-dicarboxylate transport system permease small subunit